MAASRTFHATPSTLPARIYVGYIVVLILFACVSVCVPAVPCGFQCDKVDTLGQRRNNVVGGGGPK